MCGAVVPKSELLCSDQCKDKYARMEKRQKNMRFAALFCAVFAIAVFAVLLLLRGK
jgi:predicted nucleic acid-binding Zn ribbon protein